MTERLKFETIASLSVPNPKNLLASGIVGEVFDLVRSSKRLNQLQTVDVPFVEAPDAQVALAQDPQKT
jgi:hypothetical protein